MKAKVVKRTRKDVWPAVEKVPINTEFIKLDSFLKLASAVSTGGEAKLMIQDGEVLVNGEACTQRGKKLRPGDVVRINSREYAVMEEPDEDR